MAKITEKRLYAIAPQAFTSNGTILGLVSIADTSLFVVGHIVIIGSGAVESTTLKVKRIISSTEMYVGPENTPVHSRTDISAYLLADSAFIYANEQNRPTVPEQEIERATYDEEPVVARRVSIVDKHGDKIDSVTGGDGTNRLAVDAEITLTLPEVNMEYPTNIVVTNQSIVTANTQIAHILNASCQRFVIKVRDGKSALNVGFVAGGVLLGPYFKVNRGAVFHSGDMDFVSPFTVYYSAEISGVIVEFIEWLL